MALATGTRLGPYEILAPAGAGGMGEVYKARDTRLDRTVAVKILPAHLLRREDLRQRFEREARAASSLNHPNICMVHDIGRQEDVDFLVMEWLEGETLEARLAKGPLPAPQFFEVATQIAEALDQAHQRGLVHRDLKPGNVMLTKSGAKLLDFGLAKTRQPAAAGTSADATSLPTVTHALTQEGTILGTPQYMAPEQLEGADTDARTDIFAFGAVLYEMASGRKAFDGRSQANLISSIMTSDPPPLTSAAPGPDPLPPAVDHIIRRALAKDPADRWQSVHDLLLELRWAAQSPPSAANCAPAPGQRPLAPGPRPWPLVFVAAALLVIAAAEALALFLRPAPEPPHAVRFTIALPPKVNFVLNSYDTMAVSPDGRGLVFTAVNAGQRMLYSRPLDALAAQPLAGTEGAYFPAWSPDSRFVLFASVLDHKLKKIDVTGGPPQELCDLSHTNFAPVAAWGADGAIIVEAFGGRLHRVSTTGGQLQPILELDKSRREFAQVWPLFLPDGRHFLYFSFAPASGQGGIFAGKLGSAQTRFLLNAGHRVAFVEPGWLFFERQQSLLAQPFDLSKLAVTGDPTPVADLGAAPASPVISRFSASRNGVLVYLNGGSGDSRLTWYNRDGKRLNALGEPGSYQNMTISPDGRRAAMQRTSQGSKSDLWIVDLLSGIQSRFTFGDYTASDPMWSPDSRRLAYSVTDSGKYSIRAKPIGGGPEEILLESPDQLFPQDWLPDGSLICLSPNGKNFYRLAPAGKKLETLLQSPFDKDEPHVSPDGHWIAYNSTESGRWEVYVAAFPSFTDKRQVSAAGGGQPLWRKDGKELYYLALDGAMMAVDVKTGAEIETGAPRTLFQARLSVAPTYDQYRATGDGQKFLVLDPVDEGAQQFTVVLNATAGLKR